MKTAAKDEIERLSLRYQVLSKETAMVGVVKQKEKATGELLTFKKDKMPV